PFFPMPMRMNMGGLMPEKLQEMRIRNAEAIFSAARVMFEGMQMISTRNAEMMGTAFDRLAQDAAGLSMPGEPQARLRKQAEIARSNLQMILKNIRELADLTNHCYSEALDVINKRCVEAMSEARAQLSDGSQSKKST